MKTLYLIRHAKSGRDNRNQSDIERPLNERGKKDAPVMAGIIKKKIDKIDLIVSSPAVRALTTAEVFAEKFGVNKNQLITDERIYEADTKDLLTVVQNINDSLDDVMLFGHNPGLTYFSNYLCNYETDNMPTCGVICMQMEYDSWKFSGNKIFTFKYFEYPKKYSLPPSLFRYLLLILFHLLFYINMF